MFFINIYPVANSSLYLEQNMNMFLTHLVLEDPYYRQQAIDATGYKILDNSLIEKGAAMSMKKVLEAAEIIGADEIVLPDRFRDGQGTIHAIEDTLVLYHDELKPYNLMAVVHGATEDEWIRTFLHLASLDAIDVLGIPKVMQEQFTKDSIPGRARLMNKMMPLHNKEIHLLGLWDEMFELDYYSHPELIRSIDTSLPSLLEINGLHIFNSRRECAQQTIDLNANEILSEGVTKGAKRYVEQIIYPI